MAGNNNTGLWVAAGVLALIGVYMYTRPTAAEQMTAPAVTAMPSSGVLESTSPPARIVTPAGG
jgi:hypothetical protein